MNRYLAVIISGVIAMACAHAPVHAQQRTSGMLRFDRAIILDASGFEQPPASSKAREATPRILSLMMTFRRRNAAAGRDATRCAGA